MATGYWCCERHGYFTCKARRAIFIKFSRINKLAFVGHAFLGLILIGFYLLIERFIILINSTCQAFLAYSLNHTKAL